MGGRSPLTILQCRWVGLDRFLGKSDLAGGFLDGGAFTQFRGDQIPGQAGFTDVPRAAVTGLSISREGRLFDRAPNSQLPGPEVALAAERLGESKSSGCGLGS